MILRRGCFWLIGARRAFHSMEQRDYDAAIKALNSLQSNYSVVKAIRDSGRSLNQYAIPEMIEWLGKVGYTPSDLDTIHPIHIAGTKGKGSTSAFISSILTRYSSILPKVGLYTSPHLRVVRERIQINNEPISEQLFTKYLFEVWDRLSSIGDGSKPVYFRFLTLVAFHAFIQERVETAVIECGIGGEYDSTNLFVSPTVTAVTALSIDHVGMLGDTIDQIAWHKAGIFKRGALAFTTPQPEPAMGVLQERAKEKDVNLQVVEPNAQIASGQIKIGLAGNFQQSNASLAVEVSKAHLRQLGHGNLVESSLESENGMPREFKQGLQLVKWPGRCDMRHDRRNGVTWCLDGGHTLESIEVSGQWFADEARKAQKIDVGDIDKTQHQRILIFNQQERDARALAAALFKTLSIVLGPKPFTHAIFTTNITFKETGYKPDLVSVNSNGDDIKVMRVQNELARVWNELDGDAQTMVTATIEEAIEEVRRISMKANARHDKDLMCFITGSLHLVGGALEVLESTGVS